MSNRLTTTKKGVTTILIFYAIGIILAGYGIATFHLIFTSIGIVSLVFGCVIAIMASIKPAGWMGLSKERTN